MKSFQKISKKYNLVLDIDETLVKSDIPVITWKDFNISLSSIDEPELSFIYKNTFYIWDIDERKHLRKVFVLKRPYLEEFLSFSRQYFNIYFWSAGRKLYVTQILDNILTFQPEGIFTREHIMEAEVEYPKKPLAFLQQKTGNKINLSNTIHIDDLEITFSYNKDNGLLIPPFIGSPDDTCLLILMKFLEKVKNMEIDVRKIDKNIFMNDCSSCNIEKKYLS
jgi:TFIIF-interacting CTD phosphatase-like protein